MGTKYISRKRNRRGNLVKYRDDRLVCAQQSTGAAQIANLKYILKNGSTGEFVEALDSIINERVRVALGTLVNNLDKGTGLAKVLGIDSSNDLGASSLANLASMLSVYRVPDESHFTINGDFAVAFVCASYQGDVAIFTLRAFAKNKHGLYVERCFCSENGDLKNYTITRETGGFFSFDGTSTGASIWIMDI